jgi:butyryl-CoA dehydrogenase
MSLITINSAQKLIKSEVSKFASTQIETAASDMERDGCIPSGILQKISQMGLFGLIIPEDYGGSGLDVTSLCIALEELAKSCASLAMTVAVNNCLVNYPVIRYGSAEVKKAYLNKIAGGSIGGYAPVSDIEVVGRECVLESDGACRYISNRYDIVLNSALADFFIIPVKSDQGVSLFLIDKGMQGMNSYAVSTMGLRSAGIAGLEFKHSELKTGMCLVTAESGQQAIQSVLDYAHIGFSAVALGLMQASLASSVKYAKERKQFGRSIAEFPMVQEMLAEMKIEVEKARLLIYEAASRFDADEEYRTIARIACLSSCEGAVKIGLNAIQVHGGYGYVKDYPVERYFRDAKSLQLLGESPPEMRLRIAKEILL